MIIENNQVYLIGKCFRNPSGLSVMILTDGYSACVFCIMTSFSHPIVKYLIAIEHIQPILILLTMSLGVNIGSIP